jgi:WD40 repeat protein
LKATLIHTPRTGIIYHVRFSPDGRQVMGYSMISHAVDLWDVEAARSVVHLDIGKGYDTLLLDSVPSPDWQTLYSITRRRKVTPVTENGQPMLRWEMEGAIHEWDLATGERRQSTITDPPRSILNMQIAPDGSCLLLGAERSGLSKNNERTGELCLFDTHSKTVRPVAGRYQLTGEFSPDSTRFLAMAMKTEWHAGTLHVISVSSGKVLAKGTLPGEHTVMGEAHFSPDGRQIAATFVDYPTPAEIKRLRIVLFDASTGAIQAIQEIESGHASAYKLTYSPDGKSLSFIWRGGPNYDRPRFTLLNSTDGSIRWSRPLKEKEYATCVAFRGDSQLLALATQVNLEKKIDPDPLDIPQARVQLIDPATGEVRETLIAPRGSVNDAKFSPDGQILATGSTGAVHLWDVSGLK